MKYLMIVLLCLSGCISRHDKPHPEEQVNRSLFKQQALEDTLQSVINALNSYNRSKNTICFIFFDIYNKDTIVDFRGMSIFPKSVNDSKKQKIKISSYLAGAYQAKDKDVVVYNYELESLKNILNEEVLSLEYAKELELERDSLNPKLYYPGFFSYDWTYKLSGNKLVKIVR